MELHRNERACRAEYPTWLIQLLLTIPDSNCIEIIAFQLSYSSSDDLFSLEEYTRIDAALARPSLRSLKSVRGKIAEADPRETSMYRDHLPLTDGRSILSIESDVKWFAERDLGCYSGCGWPA